ncbi:hypothetical protein GCM10011351_13100 [Paraliobacillus quinghaiensis]|uniref:Uncharacterized protein n=1 Tax=Paraliobacillus quinghaiensis TaxID=470815 RepID=A0A917TMU7_9BACI|nr:hypothetical protein GCM10011351_13100 [Paraliobacillus quinghaiensis]
MNSHRTQKIVFYFQGVSTILFDALDSTLQSIKAKNTRVKKPKHCNQYKNIDALSSKEEKV